MTIRTAWFCPSCQRHHAPHCDTCPAGGIAAPMPVTPMPVYRPIFAPFPLSPDPFYPPWTITCEVGDPNATFTVGDAAVRTYGREN